MASDIDHDALAAFCTAAELGSLSRAAATLGVAQSMLSRRLASLERRLGVVLFHRTGRGVELTEAGQRLLPRTRAILAETSALVEAAQGERDAPSGVVEIGIVPAVARLLVGPLVQRLRRDYPRIRLRVHEGYSGPIEEWLAAGRIDLGLFNRYRHGKVRSAEPFLQSDIVLVWPRPPAGGEPAVLPAGNGTVPFRALAGLPLVMPTRPNPLLAAITDLAMRRRLTLDIALEAGTGTIVRDAVADAGLATLVPEQIARQDYADPRFLSARVVEPGLRQRTWLGFTSRRPLGLAARTVGRLVREMAAP